MRCAVQVPEHIEPCQVPDPEVAERWPEPTARFMPLLRVTLMLPASATRPDAFIIASFDSTLPLLMPIETLAPFGQAAWLEAICTFHWPSKPAAAAGVAIAAPASIRMRVTILAFEKWFMTYPYVLMRGYSHIGTSTT